MKENIMDIGTAIEIGTDLTFGYKVIIPMSPQEASQNKFFLNNMAIKAAIDVSGILNNEAEDVIINDYIKNLKNLGLISLEEELPDIDENPKFEDLYEFGDLN